MEELPQDVLEYLHHFLSPSDIRSLRCVLQNRWSMQSNLQWRLRWMDEHPICLDRRPKEVCAVVGCGTRCARHIWWKERETQRFFNYVTHLPYCGSHCVHLDLIGNSFNCIGTLGIEVYETRDVLGE